MTSTSRHFTPSHPATAPRWYTHPVPALPPRLLIAATALAFLSFPRGAFADHVEIREGRILNTNPLTPAELAKRQQERRQQHEQTYRQCRELPGVFTMRDVCRLRLEGNLWTVTSLAATKARNQQVRIKIQGLGGHAPHAVLHTSSRRFFGGKLNEFNLTLASFDDPQYVQVTTTVSVQYGSLAITRVRETTSGFHTIALHHGHLLDDDFGNPLSPRSGVVMSISHHTEAGEPSNLQLIGADIADLRRRHPVETERHLRPLLRQVAAESILAADPITARQVFSKELTPDPQVATALAAILPELDLPQASRRDSALGALREQGSALALAVAHLDRRGLTDQQNTLLDAAVSPYFPNPAAEVRRLRDDSEFLMDCLYSDEPAIRAAAHQRLQSHLGRPIPFELDAPPDRRSDLIESLRATINPTTQPTTRPATQPAR